MIEHTFSQTVPQSSSDLKGAFSYSTPAFEVEYVPERIQAHFDDFLVGKVESDLSSTESSDQDQVSDPIFSSGLTLLRALDVKPCNIDTFLISFIFSFLPVETIQTVTDHADWTSKPKMMQCNKALFNYVLNTYYCTIISDFLSYWRDRPKPRRKYVPHIPKSIMNQWTTKFERDVTAQWFTSRKELNKLAHIINGNTTLAKFVKDMQLYKVAPSASQFSFLINTHNEGTTIPLDVMKLISNYADSLTSISLASTCKALLAHVIEELYPRIVGDYLEYWDRKGPRPSSVMRLSIPPTCQMTQYGTKFSRKVEYAWHKSTKVLNKIAHATHGNMDGFGPGVKVSVPARAARRQQAKEQVQPEALKAPEVKEEPVPELQPVSTQQPMAPETTTTTVEVTSVDPTSIQKPEKAKVPFLKPPEGWQAPTRRRVWRNFRTVYNEMSSGSIYCPQATFKYFDSNARLTVQLDKADKTKDKSPKAREPEQKRPKEDRKTRNQQRLEQWAEGASLSNLIDKVASGGDRAILRPFISKAVERFGRPVNRQQTILILSGMAEVENWSLEEWMCACEFTNIAPKIEGNTLTVTQDSMLSHQNRSWRNQPTKVLLPPPERELHIIFEVQTPDNSEFEAALKAGWNRYMHALNGNTDPIILTESDVLELIEPPSFPGPPSIELAPHGVGSVVTDEPNQMGEHQLAILGPLFRAVGYNYLGPGNSGMGFVQQPVNALDRLAMIHDHAYSRAQSPSDLVRADRALAWEAARLGTPQGFATSAVMFAQLAIREGIPLSSIIDGFSEYLQRVNNSATHAANGNTTSEIVAQSVALATEYCKKSFDIPTYLPPAKNVNRKPRQHSTAPVTKAGDETCTPTNGSTFWPIQLESTDAGIILMDNAGYAWSHYGVPGLTRADGLAHFSMTSLGETAYLDNTKGAINALRTNTSLINLPAVATMLANFTDNNAGTLTKNAAKSSGTSADIIVKLFLNYYNYSLLMVRPEQCDLPIYYKGVAATLGQVNLAASWQSMYPYSIDVQPAAIQYLYISTATYSAALRATGQPILPALPQAFAPETWDVSTAVVFINGSGCVSQDAMAVYAFSHLEYPLYGIVHNVTLEEVDTGNAFAQAVLGVRTTMRHRWSGPRDRILFVNLQPPSATQVGQVMDRLDFGPVQVPLDSGIIGNFPIAYQQAVLEQFQLSELNEVLGFWYGTMGSTIELVWAKNQLANCMYEFKHLPFQDRNTTIPYFRTGRPVQLADPLWIPATQNNIARELDTDRFSPLGVQAAGILTIQGDLVQLEHSTLPHVIRGLLSMGLIMRNDAGLGEYIEGSWLWTGGDMSDLRNVAEAMIAGSDAVAASKAIILSQIYSSAPNQIQMTQWREISRRYSEMFVHATTGVDLIRSRQLATGISRERVLAGLPALTMGLNRYFCANFRVLGYEYDALTINNKWFSSAAATAQVIQKGMVSRKRGDLNNDFYVGFSECNSIAPAILNWLCYAPGVAAFNNQVFIEGQAVAAWGALFASPFDGYPGYITEEGATRAEYEEYYLVPTLATWYFHTAAVIQLGGPQPPRAMSPKWLFSPQGNNILNGQGNELAFTTVSEAKLDDTDNDPETIRLYKMMMAPLELGTPFQSSSQDQRQDGNTA